MGVNEAHKKVKTPKIKIIESRKEIWEENLKGHIMNDYFTIMKNDLKKLVGFCEGRRED